RSVLRPGHCARWRPCCARSRRRTKTLAGAAGFGETHVKLFFCNGTLTLAGRMQEPRNFDSANQPLCRPPLEKRDDALLGSLRRRAGAVVEVNGQDRVRRHRRGCCVFWIELDGLELVSKDSPVGVETCVRHEPVLEKA